MALTNYADFKARLDEQVFQQQLQYIITPFTSVGGFWYDTWTSHIGPGTVGTAPTTAVAPNRTTAGAWGQLNGDAGALTILGVDASMYTGGTMLLYDRLSHMGGLSGVTTGTITTNLPTAALTRYTDGVGVMAYLTITTLIGTTANTFTISYTNEAGTAGRTSPSHAFGGTNNNLALRTFFIGMQSGDHGVRSIQSITRPGTTGTAGAFGMGLMKPLALIGVGATGAINVNPISGGPYGPSFPVIEDNACLGIMCMTDSTFMAGGLRLHTSEV